MKHKVYCCTTDARYHIPEDNGGIQIYFSLDSAKRHCSCWEECGVTELILDCSKPKVAVKENFELAMKNARTSNQIAWDYVRNGPYKILKTVFVVLRDIKWAIKELARYNYYRLLYRIYGKRK